MLTGDGKIRGGKVEGSERVNEEVKLTPTSDAPAGAHGSAVIRARNHRGSTGAVLKLEVEGLAAGTYTAQVTSAADGSVTVLGSFDVTADSNDDGEEVEFGGRAGLPFPDGFNPLDAALVQILDAAGVVLLTGDFTNVTAAKTVTYAAKVHVTPGPAAPDAAGTVATGTRVRHHVAHHSFTLAAKGVPPETTLTLKINGTAVRAVDSSHSGRVVVRKLPATVQSHKITSVTLEDADGNRVLSAHF